MRTPKSDETILKSLEGNRLSAVTFVLQDYLQLHFDGSLLNVYVWPRIRTGELALDRDTPGYRDALCRQIGKHVGAAIEEPNDKLVIQFVDGTIVEISLKEEDRNGPEAAMLQIDAGKRWNVW
jgi:hypothetical protein